MDNRRLFEGESRFMHIIWEQEPVPSGKLVELCLDRLGWKKSTTYTMLKRLADKGFIRNEGAVVTSLVSESEVQAAESAAVVDQSFSGSLPGFVAAFFSGRGISAEEAAELKRLIDERSEKE